MYKMSIKHIEYQTVGKLPKIAGIMTKRGANLMRLHWPKWDNLSFQKKRS
jgi:hypothetical protein